MVKKEYIERKSLLQDINETVLFSCRVESITLESRGANKVIGRIKAQPTADVVEVVRCKNCKFFKTDAFNQKICVRQFNTIRMNENDFCSYGAKMEGNNG